MLRLLLLAPLVSAHDQAANDFRCAPASLGNRTCYANPEGRLGGTVRLSTAASCCELCKDHAGCEAFTWFGGDKCNMFSSVGSTSSSDPTCVSGMGSAMPPAPPPDPEHKWPPFDPQPWKCKFPQPDGSCIKSSCKSWTPPPPHGPPCKDCPNIVFSLTDGAPAAAAIQFYDACRLQRVPLTFAPYDLLLPPLPPVPSLQTRTSHWAAGTR